ncbi:MAG: LysR family transcriptional regulator [Burkholderiales bacterium RIFCSPHIGHO2_12_FULL_69_20]|nr:MAG: LysR family transcriptional regulator [Burkholderiales bacterium RIFCSPHIGHO2_12_FULL_69_20]
MNFRQLDLNLLRVLCAVQRTGSVTEAGRQLAMSQPAVSNALARLRRSLDDALFVRSPTGLHPTRLAQRVVPEVTAHLRDLEALLCRGESFDPATADVHWRLSLSDLGEMMFLPPLAAALRTESPHCRVSNVAVDATRVSAALEARDIDLAIGILLPEHAGIASESLFHEHFVAITGSHWRPAVGRTGKSLTTQQLAHASLAVAAPTATFHGSVESMLTRLKLSDRAVVRARHYGALPELVTCTDLMAIVPQMFASSLATRYDVRVWELPGHGPHYNVRMVWHESAAKDAAHAWLREWVRRLFARPEQGAVSTQ